MDQVHDIIEEEEEDRISNLPVDIIHCILFFLDMKYAIQTSILSKKWNIASKELQLFLLAHKSVLYGYVLDARVHFPVVERHAKAAWGKFGYRDAMMNKDGFFFFRFNDEGGSNRVEAAPLLMVRGVPLFVYRWDPTKGLRKLEHDTCPLWVKLHNIPLVVFNREGLSSISSALGYPIYMDDYTATMCEKGFGSRAKVLVEVWAVGELQRKIKVILPDINGGEDITVYVEVEYLWEPSQCSHCRVFGHRTASCVKTVQQTQGNKGDGTDVNGFFQVEKRQWRPKSHNRVQDQRPKNVKDLASSSRGDPSVTRNQNGNMKDGSAPDRRKEQEVVQNRVAGPKGGTTSNTTTQPSTSNKFRPKYGRNRR